MRELGLYYSPDDGSGGKDRLGANGLQVEIGTSLYTFSEETQRYLYPVRLADYQTAWLGLPPDSNLYPEYDHNKSVLFVSDPHFNANAQFRIYKGLESFFYDNPTLVRKTAFLAEGSPANQSISVKSLIDTDSNPSDELIKNVLDSFLINGFMAYEWKHQEGIPIVGIEDQPLYVLSRDYALLHKENPNKYFYSGSSEEIDRMIERDVPSLWQDLKKAQREFSSRGRTVKLSEEMSVVLSDRLVWNFTYGAAYGFICTARNQEMARELITRSSAYENPILFAGGSHLLGGGSLEFQAIKLLTRRLGPQGPFGSDAFQSCINAVDRGIYHFLRDEKVAFTFLDPEKLGDQQGDIATYYKLFQAQQGVDKQNMSYEEYMNWLLQQRGMKRETTARPSPETAAEYIKRLKEQEAAEQKSEVVYERKEEAEERPHWAKISHDEVWNVIVKDSIWHQPQKWQGEDFEKVREVNLGSNCPHIDDIVIDAMTATQHKSMDLTADTYQNVRTLESKVSGYIDKLSEFNELTWSDKKRGIDYDLIRGRDFQDRYLEVGIPAGRATQEQIEKLVDLQEYAQSKDVTLVIVEIP